MKKLICVVVLCLFLPLTFADEASVQKVLDSVHSKGFVGCDDQIRRMYEYITVSHVETKMPLSREKITDEIIVIVETPDEADHDWKDGISSAIFRKVGNRCFSTYNYSLGSSINRNCSQLAKFMLSKPKLVAETHNSFWMRMDGDVFQQGGPVIVFTPLSEGGCRQIRLPE